MTMRHNRVWVAILGVLLGGCSGTIPEGLGVRDGRLAPCPPSPNCVCSQAADAAHRIPPIAYQGERAAARERLLKTLTTLPRTKVTTVSDSYLHAASASALFGFVDDLEFFFPEGRPVIEVRSAARLGWSDFGVNRRRIETLRTAFNAPP
jgi:uncharacterized protein (DUF1499 family)